MNKLSKSCCLIIVGLIILLSSCSADNNTKQTEPLYSSATETESSYSTAETETTTVDNGSNEAVSIESIKEHICSISVEQAKDITGSDEYKKLNRSEVIAVKTILIKQGLNFISKNKTKYNQCESEVQILLMDVIFDETPEILISYYNKDNIPCLDAIECVSDNCTIHITIMGLECSDIRFLASIDERNNQCDSYMVKTSYIIDKTNYTDWNIIQTCGLYSGLICRKIVNDDETVEWESYRKGEKTDLSAEEIEDYLSDTSYGYAKTEKDNIISEPFYTSDKILIEDINSDNFVDEIIISIMNSTK